jgi:hypothetical protein
MITSALSGSREALARPAKEITILVSYKKAEPRTEISNVASEYGYSRVAWEESSMVLPCPCPERLTARLFKRTWQLRKIAYFRRTSDKSDADIICIGASLPCRSMNEWHCRSVVVFLAPFLRQ